MNPLRVGILGAARISNVALIDPAHELGVELVAVAARDRSRGEAFAKQHGVETVYSSYAEVIADPRVDAIYNPLPNSMHAPWNLAAIAGGKHVLTEKPFASNAAQARTVHEAASRAGLVVFEGFHYRYHPQFARLAEIIQSRLFGQLEQLDVTMAMPAPAPDDLRWSWALSGGAMMDLGCYCVHAIRSVSALLGGEPSLVGAIAGERTGSPQVDEWFEAEFALAGAHATPAFLHANMASETWDMSIRATGSSGSATIVDFIHPQDDDRLLLHLDDSQQTEHTGSRSTYSYQLEAFVAAIREERPFLTDSADSVATMELIDACYQAVGMTPRNAAS